MRPETDRYTQLLALVWSVEAGSFSAAARQHDLSPSAISKLVGKLENRLGVRLFHRLPRSVVPTLEGLDYYRTARNALDAMADADSVGDALGGEATGMLRVHTMPTFAQHQIAPWLPEFLSAQPSLRLEFRLAAQYSDQFDQGVDLAIHSGAIASPSRIARQIATSRWVVCAAPSYLQRHGTPRHPGELATHRCLNFGFSSPWNHWHFRLDGGHQTVELDGHLSTSQGDLLREVALNGGGIARLAEFHIGADLEAGRLLPVLAEFADEKPEPLYAVYAARKHLSPRIRVFLAHLERVLATRAWNRPPTLSPTP